MKKVWKKIWICILTLTIIVSNFSTMNVNASENDSEDFSGRREMVYSADSSDMDNFIDGGRSIFDILLRKNAPEWLEYEISAKDREVFLLIAFEFTSFEDYKQKLEELLTYSPNLVKDDADQLMLLEGNSALDYLGFLQSILAAQNDFNEGAIAKIFKVTKNVIEIDSQEYKTLNERLAVKSANNKAIKVNSLDVYTCGTEANTYSRSITVQTNIASDSEKLKKRFEKVGEVEQEEITESMQTIVTFGATDMRELAQKTMECLYISCSVSEHQVYVDDNMVGVSCTEFMDISELLKENGTCSYIFEYPEYYSNVSSEVEEISVDNQKITTENIASISYYYERGFKFNTIKVNTDLTNLLGEKIRTITLVTPTEIGTYYHEIIKDWCQKQVIKGTTLDIYDEGGNRYYQFRFSSYFWNDIEDFTKSILNGSCLADAEETWIPFGKNSVKEEIKIGTLISEIAPSSNISVSYTLNQFSKFASQNMKEDMVILGKTVEFQVVSGEEISFYYRGINLIKCVIELLAIVLVVSFIIFIKKKLQKKTRKTPKARLCPNCGSAIDLEQEFCGKCGTRLK